jgi:hypothetical protein
MPLSLSACTCTLMFLLPINKINNATIVVPVMIATIGTADLTSNILTPKEANAPNPICTAPINAEALPAFLLKGARDKAEVFGLVKPRQHRNKKSKIMVSTSPNQWLMLPNRKNSTMTSCELNAARINCSLLYFLSIRVLTWLEPINPTDNKAKIQPYPSSETLKNIDEHQRRTRDIGKESRKGKCSGEGIGIKLRFFNYRKEVLNNGNGL